MDRGIAYGEAEIVTTIVATVVDIVDAGLQVGAICRRLAFRDWRVDKPGKMGSRGALPSATRESEGEKS